MNTLLLVNNSIYVSVVTSTLLLLSDLNNLEQLLLEQLLIRFTNKEDNYDFTLASN